MKRIFKTHLFLFLILGFFFSRFWNLTNLPVFADEAIYIRWAQVAFHQPEQYLFLSMLDGKPPLHIWLMAPFVTIPWLDPLWMGRCISVLLGLVTIGVMYKIVQTLGGKKEEQFWMLVVMIITPFWFLFGRMALTESLINLCFAFTLWWALQAVIEKKRRAILMYGLGLGIALWTKTNTLFFIPLLALLPFLFDTFTVRTWKKFLRTHFVYYFGIIVGLGIFSLLKFSPLFPSLFTRSVDYTFTFSALLHGEWKYVLFTSWPRTLLWVGFYMTPFLLCFLFFRKASWKFVFLSFLYMLPLVTFGKVLYSRYFYPVLIPFSIALAFAIPAALHSRHKNLAKKLLVLYVATSLVFIGITLVNANQTPFMKEDTAQYLTEWSSGHGIVQVRDFLLEELEKREQNHDTAPIYVATEGYFGTLPDGLLLYFDASKYAGKIEIHGIGEPIREFSSELLDRTQRQPVYVVVNQDRFFYTNTDHYDILHAYERPYGAPKLLLLRLK